MERSPRFLIALAVLAVVELCSGCSTCGPRSVRVNLDDVSYLVRGGGLPTVVLEAGIGDDLSSWTPVFDGIAGMTTTFAYSRPGYGTGRHRHSAEGPRTAGDAVSFLRHTLRTVGLPPPYVLVGHSSGATYLLHFAALHSEDVAGIVLVDARLPGFRDECRSLGLDSCRPPGPWGGRAAEHVRAELRGLRASLAETPAARELGRIPITVIAAERPPPQATEERQRLWLDLQRRYADDAAAGRFVAASGCGHYVHRDDPDLVIGEVRSLLERIGT